MLIIFFDTKRIVKMEFFLACKTANSAYYCKVLLRMHENVRRLHPELWRQKIAAASRQLTVSHFLYHQGFFTKNNMTSPHTLLLSVSSIEDKLKGRHFETNEVIEAESQAMLNTLTERDSQGTFKQEQECWEGAYARKGTTSRVMVSSAPS
jgi:hypothetical protein